MRAMRRLMNCAAPPDAANIFSEEKTMTKPETTKNRSTPAAQGRAKKRSKAAPASAAVRPASFWAWWNTTMTAASARSACIEKMLHRFAGQQIRGRLTALYRGLVEDPARAGEDGAEHVRRQYARVRVVARAMVAIEQRDRAVERELAAVGEGKGRSCRRPPAPRFHARPARARRWRAGSFISPAPPRETAGAGPFPPAAACSAAARSARR